MFHDHFSGFSPQTTRQKPMSSNIIFLDNTSSNGFLCNYVETSVEKPANGHDGDCIIHYGEKHCKCEMMVKLVNGVREGEAILVDDGIPIMRLEYRNGILSGPVEQMNECGRIVLRGHLVNGLESGLFEEYDTSGAVKWIGYYRNGKRDIDWSDRIVCRVGNLGSGEFYELDESGNVFQLCSYEKGIRSRVIAHFASRTMTEYDANEKRVYEGEFKGDMKNGFVRNGKGKEYSNAGKTVVYSGDWKDGKRQGRGTEYRDYKPVFIGEWRDGKRDGDGEEMNENGTVMRSGKWVNGTHESEIRTIVQPSSLIRNPIEIEELIIESGYNQMDGSVLKLTGLVRLNRIVMGDRCFGSVRSFAIIDLKQLTDLEIGEHCFTYSTNYTSIETSSRTDGVCQIADCPVLHSIVISSFTFADYHSFELNNLPFLQTVELGESCFHWTPLFALNGGVSVGFSLRVS